MNTKNTESNDARNRSFESPELRLEDHKPGFKPAEQQQATAGGDHRFPRRREKKDVPQESLAERIRRASKGG
jgi:hypothetical protein